MPVDSSFPLTQPQQSGLVLQTALRSGVGAGLACGLWMLALQLMGNNGFGPKQLLAQLLVPLIAVSTQWWLRHRLAPAKPGLQRSVGVGILVALFAALVSAGSLAVLAYGFGEEALAKNRAEVLEIVQAQQRENAKVVVTPQQRADQLLKVQNLTVGDMALSNFTQVLLLGLVLALPAGVFLRE